jgi:hypothetical protein
MTVNAPAKTITEKTRVSLSTRDLVLLGAALIGVVLYQERRHHQHSARLDAVEQRVSSLKEDVMPALRDEVRATRLTVEATNKDVASTREAVARLEGRQPRNP